MEAYAGLIPLEDLYQAHTKNGRRLDETHDVCLNGDAVYMTQLWGIPV